jgi:hypothetical protein
MMIAGMIDRNCLLDLLGRRQFVGVKNGGRVENAIEMVVELEIDVGLGSHLDV